MKKSVQIKVALIGAVATVLAALLGGILTSSSDAPSSPRESTTEEIESLDSSEIAMTIEFLEFRAMSVQSSFEICDSLMARGSTMFDFSLDSLRTLQSRFNDLYAAHVAALRSRNFILAHEIDQEIGDILSIFPSHSEMNFKYAPM